MADAEPTLRRGQNFPNSKAAFHAVQDFALFQRKRVRVVSRGGKHRRLACASASPCGFFVQLYQHNSKTDSSWYVSSCELRHADECDATPKPTQRQILESAAFRQAVQAAGTNRATARELLAAVPGSANIRTVYRAKDSMKRMIRDDLGASYRMIPSLLRVYQELNPGPGLPDSVARYETNVPRLEAVGEQEQPVGAFRRAFVACGVFFEAAPFNQQIYGIDCIRATNVEAEYEGYHLFLLGRDGNLESMVVAAACCDAPTRDNYRWFIQCIRDAGISLQGVPLLCGMDPELLCLEAELGLKLRFCTRYIIEKELTQLNGFSQQHQTQIWGLQSSETFEDYNNQLNWIATLCGPTVANYLQKLPVERWAVVGNLNTSNGVVSVENALYGCRSRNFYDSDEQEQEDALKNEWSRELISNSPMVSESKQEDEQGSLLARRFRNMLPFEFLESVMDLFMQQVYARSQLAGKMKQLKRQITPRAQELFNAEKLQSSSYRVTRASDNVSYVVNPKKQNGRRRVDFVSTSCTCSFIDQYGIPCRHFLAALLFSKRTDVDYSRYKSCYWVESYERAYRGKSIEMPLKSSLSEDPFCESSLNSGLRRQRQPSGMSANGTMSKKRKHQDQPQDGQIEGYPNQPAESNQSEVSDMVQARPVRERLCRKCRRPGHNVRSCSYEGPLSLTDGSVPAAISQHQVHQESII